MSAPLPVPAALALLLAEVVPTEAESVPLEECLGRVTAAEVRAPGPLPGFDNSAMDGFAIHSADAGLGARLRIVGESRAGHPAASGPGRGEALRISTGAMMPPGADAVVQVELTAEEGGEVVLEGPVAPGRNVRRAGEDLEAGGLALGAGARIGAPEIGVLASTGLATVQCARRPRVAVLTSGDELLGPGERPQPGAIYDSNRFSLVAAARAAGAEAAYEGSIADDPGRTEAAIESVLGADLVVVSGGVSVGRHDHVKTAFGKLGVERLFWRIAMRPGGPTWGGVLRRDQGRPTVVLGLPGNPVSAAVTFRLFGHTAVLAMLGLDPGAERTSARLDAAYEKPLGRAHYLRCRLSPTPAGWRVALTREHQGSHVLTSMLGADCLAVIPAERGALDAGEEVEVLLL